ncbi:MAG: sodium/proline symporter, partial [Okeania sp. SIO2H7]|nr:sodium/proline symporter [Okeania sp. SIO2H7]
MTDTTTISVTFIAFLLFFVLIGISAAIRKQDTTTDYLLASRNVNPWLTGLSAMATAQSGFIFTGLVGLSYKLGVASIWYILCHTAGEYISWWLLAKRLRKMSAETDAETFSSFLSEKGG